LALVVLLASLPACAPPALATEPVSAPAGTPGPVAQVFDIGGRGLYLQCEGRGTPLVVLEAGLGGGADVWAAVLPALSETTRVCAYDRAGLGLSDPPRLRPRTSLDVAQDLHALLVAAGEPGPYVLVGHSMGGYHVRVYAGQYPEEVAGMVLVDASHPDQAQAFLDALPEDSAEITGALRREIEAGFSDPSSNAEDLDVATSAELVRASGGLGDRPLVVVTANQAGNQSGPDVPDEIDEAFDAAWLRLQAELVGLSTQGTQVMAPRGGHMVPVDAPEIVIEAARDVVAAVRNGS
jgi:pimeloyl-ACP methyl ester carboxylesterase